MRTKIAGPRAETREQTAGVRAEIAGLRAGTREQIAGVHREISNQTRCILAAAAAIITRCPLVSRLMVRIIRDGTGSRAVGSPP